MDVLSEKEPALRVMSWNVWHFNTQFEEILSFLRNALIDHDVICLQEVSAELLSMLHRLGCEVFMGTDISWQIKSSGEVVTDSLVILSKHPIASTHTYHLPFRRHSTPQATFFSWFTTRKDDSVCLFRDEHKVISVDLEIGGRKVRVFCAHLTFWRATCRAEEFQVILDNLAPNSTNVVCGDLNIFDNPVIPFNMAMSFFSGDSLLKVMPWYSERRSMNNTFQKAGFANPLAGRFTLKKFGNWQDHMQLDHILVPESALVTERKVYSDTHGSDHLPVSVAFQV